ncbi:Uncharacterised protein [Chlamydia trachomatis]|nr:Uncharacterised protein [Chlamydia trachomatis]
MTILVQNKHVHSTKLFQIGLSCCINEANLFATVFNTLVFTEQGSRIISTTLSKTSTTRTSAEPLIFNPNTNWLQATFKIWS